ncbi:MAG: PadR family transcriptional regulator [Pseudonocardiales bacterium]
MATSEVLLALLREQPRHGYEIKHEYDAWFPDSKPLAFGQVYSTLGRLARDGLVHVMETRQDGAPERTVYALTDQGQDHLRAWLTEPAPAEGTSAEEIVRKTVAALRTGTDTAGFLTRQRASHLRRMHELQRQPPGRDPASRLAREHTLARLDADLRWLDMAAELTRREHEKRTTP